LIDLPLLITDDYKGGETNAVKEALKAGKADVLTLATREPAPDECIPKFVNLGVSV
jgi:hypothetical protein